MTGLTLAFAGIGSGEDSVPVSSLLPGSAVQGWGTLQYNRSVGGKILKIAGKSYDLGLGTHAPAEITYDLDGRCAGKFEAWVGVDDEMTGYKDSSVVFQVLGDGRKLFDSGVMRLNDPAKRVSVDLAGIDELKLVVTDAGDGMSCDHADWAEAVLTGMRELPALPGKYVVAVPGLTIHLDERGRIAGASPVEVPGQTRLGGCRTVGEVAVKQVAGGGYAFTRGLADSLGHHAVMTERFIPDKDSIRWDVEITSADAPWSAPVVSQLRCAKPRESMIWAAWGSPDFSGVTLSPEVAARVQAGKATASGHWSDPLVATGFLNRAWHYGNVAQSCPVGADYVVMPLFTLITPSNDTGLSVVLSPADVLLNLDLAVSESGQFQFARSNHRLGLDHPLKFSTHLVPHEASWRGGLRFMTARYPEFFEAPNPRVHRIAGCGAYSVCEASIDVEKFKRMAFGFNWKLSDDFPYMGMFIPPVKDADESWTRSCDEKSPPEKGPTTSCRQMNDYAKTMKQNGFSVLSYFNVTEFGKNMYGRKAVAAADDPALWKDPVAYLQYRLPNAVFDPGIQTCYKAFITDPGEPGYLNFMLEQAKRNTTMLPDTDGICIDRADWLRLYNRKADDGVSWIDDKPARSLFRSWAALMSKLGPQMHQADKVIFSNLMTVRLELGRELDGIYTEFGNNGNALNGSALLGTRKPVVAWTYNETLHQPNPDDFMQRHLHLGVFPTAPYPYNNHCINPEPGADRLYQEYGPLLNSMCGKKWVLAPHCVECDSAKVNLFEVAGGYALPVTFGGSAQSAIVRIRNVPGFKDPKCAALHPGNPTPVPLTGRLKDDALELVVPLVRGCAMVRLSTASDH